MFDRLIAFGIALADKHLALATLLLGVVSLYVLGFNAANLSSQPYAIVALILFDMFIRVSTYTHVCAKLHKLSDSMEDYDELSESVSQLSESFNMQMEILNNMVNNATQLNNYVVRIYTAIQGMPNKQQFKLIINLSTQKLSLELLQIYTSYACSNKNTMIDPMLTVQKMNWDFDAVVHRYIENAMLYNNQVFSETMQNNIKTEISKYTDTMCSTLTGSQSTEDKFYSAMIAAKSLESNLTAIWDSFIKSLPDSFPATIHTEGD